MYPGSQSATYTFLNISSSFEVAKAGAVTTRLNQEQNCLSTDAIDISRQAVAGASKKPPQLIDLPK